MSRSASRCSAGSSEQVLEVPASFRFLHGQRSARPIEGTVSSPSGVRPQVTFLQVTFLLQGGSRHFTTDYPGPQAAICDSRRALRRCTGAISDRQGGAFAANVFRRADA